MLKEQLTLEQIISLSSDLKNLIRDYREIMLRVSTSVKMIGIFDKNQTEQLMDVYMDAENISKLLTEILEQYTVAMDITAEHLKKCDEDECNITTTYT